MALTYYMYYYHDTSNYYESIRIIFVLKHSLKVRTYASRFDAPKDKGRSAYLLARALWALLTSSVVNEFCEMHDIEPPGRKCQKNITANLQLKIDIC